MPVSTVLKKALDNQVNKYEKVSNDSSTHVFPSVLPAAPTLPSPASSLLNLTA